MPSISLEGDANGAPHPDAGSYADKFTGMYEHRVIGGGVGHNLPQEAPQAFAQAVMASKLTTPGVAFGAQVERPGPHPVPGRHQCPGLEVRPCADPITDIEVGKGRVAAASSAEGAGPRRACGRRRPVDYQRFHWGDPTG